MNPGRAAQLPRNRTMILLTSTTMRLHWLVCLRTAQYEMLH